MSSKKKLRQKRREQNATQRRKGIDPGVAFILITAALVVVIGVVAALVGGPERGTPPRPGAVWSAEHGHWH